MTYAVLGVGFLLAVVIYTSARTLATQVLFNSQARASLQTGAETERNRRHEELLAALNHLTDEIGLITTAAALRDNKTDIALEEFRERLYRAECEQYDLAVRAQAAAPIRLKLP